MCSEADTEPWRELVPLLLVLLGFEHALPHQLHVRSFCGTVHMPHMIVMEEERRKEVIFNLLLPHKSQLLVPVGCWADKKQCWEYVWVGQLQRGNDNGRGKRNGGREELEDGHEATTLGYYIAMEGRLDGS